MTTHAENMAILAAAGWFLKPPDIHHLARHFDDNLEVGSKMPASQKDTIIAAAQEALAAACAERVSAGKVPDYVEIQLEDFTGFGALVPLQADKQLIRVLRDAGTPHEYEVNCHLVDRLPEDDRVWVVGGRIRTTRKLGIYTIIVGEPAKPMPKKGDASFNARCLDKYWEKMAFLVTKQQLGVASIVL